MGLAEIGRWAKSREKPSVMHTYHCSPEGLGKTVNILLQSCVAVWRSTSSIMSERRQTPYVVKIPLTKTQRSLSCCSAFASVLSSIFEYTSLDPCIGQAARKISVKKSTATPINIAPGRIKKAGTVKNMTAVSSTKRKLCNTMSRKSRKSRKDIYSSAFGSEVRKGRMIHGRYASLVMRTAMSCANRRKGLLRAASVVVLERASIWDGMNSTALAMAGDGRVFAGIGGSVLVVWVC